jgi:Zn-finger in ubiquitin-hydrolases and other protein
MARSAADNHKISRKILNYLMPFLPKFGSLKTPLPMPQLCQHLNQLQNITVANQPVCEECVKIGSGWVHLRTCQQCGQTHCCDASPHRHATRHFQASGHPVVASAEPGEQWVWCYVHEQFAEY